jgi:uridine kinase
MIRDELLNKIKDKARVHDPVIVGICGAADLGKSFLSIGLKDTLLQDNIRASHLSLGSFLMARKERSFKELSGYQIESYRVNEATNCLNLFKEKKPFHYFPYNHNYGCQTSTSIEISNSSVLLFEGLQVLNQSFKHDIDMSVFIFTGDQELRKIRTDSDIHKRGLSLEQSLEISDIELNNYKRHVEPYREISEYKVWLENKWNYKFV